MINEELKGPPYKESDKEVPLSFNKLLPIPEELEEQDNQPYWLRGESNLQRCRARYGASTSYNWARNNWGVSSEIADHNFFGSTVEESYLRIHFRTPWIPPILIAKAISRRFPFTRIGIAYDESGDDFGGFNIFDNGDDVANAIGPSASMSDSSWEDKALTVLAK